VRQHRLPVQGGSDVRGGVSLIPAPWPSDAFWGFVPTAAVSRAQVMTQSAIDREAAEVVDEILAAVTPVGTC
jgi:hypothetical protein